MEAVLDLEIIMEVEDWEHIKAYRTLHEYRPFQSATVRSRSNGALIASFDSSGEIRARGQSSCFFSGCFGIDAMPFTVKFNNEDEDQNFFGAGTIYLRSHFSDQSFLREYSLHRMLARFGLPYLRVRTVRLFMNGQYVGLYDLMEGVTQEYIFARNYPDYDPDNFALYKFRTESMGCGEYESNLEPEIIDTARNEPELTEEYVPDFPPPETANWDVCMPMFMEFLGSNMANVIRNYYNYDGDCGEVLVEEEYVDRKFGNKDTDSNMKDFLNKDLFCASNGCVDSNFVAEVDVDSFLKSAAFYTATLGFDSPLGNGNNFYLAQTGDNAGWKMYPWDFDSNLIATFLCAPRCGDTDRMIHWPIVQPTCGALEDNKYLGPLLSDQTLHAKYISYVREFVTTIVLNTTFIEELEDHAKAIKEDVKDDPYTAIFPHNFTPELLADPSAWDSTLPYLPGLTARAYDIMEQLKALDNGTYPRGPFQETKIESWEVCPDWRWTEPKGGLCPMNCEYCFSEPDWVLQGECILGMGCFHGELDSRCDGVPDLEAYEGMEPRGTEETFCSSGMKVSQCEWVN